MGEKFGDPVERLLEAFPDVAAIRFFTDNPYTFPGPYFAFAAFAQYLVALQESGLDPESLRRGYAFAEEMATGGDDEAHNIVGIQICEYLAEQEFLDHAAPHMGSSTIRMAEEFAESFGKPKPGKSRIYKGIDIERYQRLFAEELIELGGPENVHDFSVGALRDQVLRRLRGEPRKGKARHQ